MYCLEPDFIERISNSFWLLIVISGSLCKVHEKMCSCPYLPFASCR